VIVPNGPPVISEVSASDLRAKAARGQEFALLDKKRVEGILYDTIDFDGTAGWVRNSDTSDGWGGWCDSAADRTPRRSTAVQTNTRPT
jgi:hypothetical protein